ncbi:syncytin-1-like [Xenopus laevis]|uniref:Syncytin-1-like n=1 Tax=Xenopus laevis TaxID=8355 RepID=A0A8J0T8U6_XENLA|nr:syncytin-1-like [Xenopus laevis]
MENKVPTFWFNSSNTNVATFIFSACDLYPDRCTRHLHRLGVTGYICVTDEYLGYSCDHWGSVGWNTGTPWGYQPQSAISKVDDTGRSLLERMTLKTGPTTSKFTLSIQHPSSGDADHYVFGLYNAGNQPLLWFDLKDMYQNNYTDTQTNPIKPNIATLNDMVAISNPTFADTMAVETGFSDVNVWLEWIHYTANKHNRRNCFVCGGARSHLGTVPLDLLSEVKDCFLSLFTNSTTNHSLCEVWKSDYPIIPNPPRQCLGITIYPGNYTCYYNYNATDARPVGNFSDGYCSNYSDGSAPPLQRQTQSLSDVFWICGDMRIRSHLRGNWYGECALCKAIMPLHIIPWGEPTVSNRSTHTRQKRNVLPGGSLDPHVYIDAIGVPRGVPNEFKACDQVKAGFESLIPLITINKNVDWINYIYYNQQRFVNYTRDALQGLAEQLESTSQMTVQNRIALDMLLAERGGVCKFLDKSTTCCTYIPDNTGPNGKVTLAIKKLDDLSIELKKNSGITDPWDQFFGWLTGWKKTLAQIGVVLLIVLLVTSFFVCCLLPYIRKLTTKAIDASTPTFLCHPGAPSTDTPLPPLPPTTLSSYIPLFSTQG